MHDAGPHWSKGVGWAEQLGPELRLVVAPWSAHPAGAFTWPGGGVSGGEGSTSCLMCMCMCHRACVCVSACVPACVAIHMRYAHCESMCMCHLCACMHVCVNVNVNANVNVIVIVCVSVCVQRMCPPCSLPATRILPSGSSRAVLW